VEPFSIKGREQIIAALERAKANRPCPRCQHTEFALIDGYEQILLREEPAAPFTFGGPTIPVALMVCTRCGFIARHAIGALGLMPQGVAENAGQIK
jgi:ribosomal protein S27AE